MTQVVETLVEQAQQLTWEDRADLVDQLIIQQGNLIPAAIERAQFNEVRRRIAEVESGEVELLDLDDVMAEATALAEGKIDA